MRTRPVFRRASIGARFVRGGGRQLVIATMVAHGSATMAETGPPTEPIRFEEVLRGAAEHPDLRASQNALKVRTETEGKMTSLSADPQLVVLPGLRLPGAENPGVEIQVTLSQSVSLGGLGSKKQAAAKAERAEAAASIRAAALTRSLDAARAWLVLQTREREQDVLTKQVQGAWTLVERLKRARELGAALESEVTEASLFARELERSAIDAEGLCFEQALVLSGALARSGESVLVTEGPPPEVVVPPSETWPEWISLSHQLPDLERQELAERASNARRAEEVASGATRLVPTVSFQFERPKDIILWAGMGVQLPVFDANLRQRAVSESQHAFQQGRALSAEMDAERLLRGAFHEVQHRRDVEDHMKTHELPTLQRWVEQTTRLFEAQETDIFPVLRARQRLADLTRASLRIEEERRWAEVQVWLLLEGISSESRGGSLE